LLLGFFSELYSKEPYSSIVIGKFKSLERADNTIEIFKDIIKTEDTLQKLQKKHLFSISKKNVDGQYLITVGDFYNEEILAVTYYSIKEYFPDTIIIKYKGDKVVTKEIPNEIKNNIINNETSNNGLWFALIGAILMLVGLVALYIKHIKILRDNYLEMKMEHNKLEETQSLLLSAITKKIKESAEQLISDRDKIFSRPVEELSSDMLKSASEKSKNRDDILLDTTSNLIIYLQLKSKKITTNNELFNINNILNEVSGQILSKCYGNGVELVFDVSDNVPKLMVGDLNHITTVLLNLLQYSLKSVEGGEVRLMIDATSINNQHIDIKFEIITERKEGILSPNNDKKDNVNLLEPFGGADVMSGNNLGLYIAKELVELMGGKIGVSDNNGVIFDVLIHLNLPDNVISKRSSDNLRLGVKKVLIVERSNSSAMALERILRHFEYDTTIKPLEKLSDDMDELIYFDIFAIDIELISNNIAKSIEILKAKSNVKVIALSSLLHNSNIDGLVANIIDKHLIKPLHSERVYEVLINIFNDDDYVSDGLLRVTNNNQTKNSSSETQEKLDIDKIDINDNDDGVKAIPKVYKGEISDTEGTNEDSFKVFAGAKLMIVEDNIINQKVLLRVLNHSGITINVANNGEEAIKMMDESGGAYDFILMDISMPIMDGYTATKIIRENSDYDRIPIVSLTSLALDHEIRKMYHLGMNAHLTKPMKIGQLYSVFSLFLSKSNYIDINQKFEPYESGHYLELDVDVTYIEDSDVLDTHNGIIYSQGSEVLYIEVLREFLDAYSNNFSLFKEYVNDKEYLKVKALTKDMGGLLGAIGANSMTHLLSEINQLFVYQEEKQLALYVESYTNELKSLIHQIEQYIYSRDRKIL